MKQAHLFLGGVLLALGLAACGGQSTTSSSSPPQPQPQTQAQAESAKDSPGELTLATLKVDGL